MPDHAYDTVVSKYPKYIQKEIREGRKNMRGAFMAYVTGSVEAAAFYGKAFHAQPKNCFKASDKDDYYAHAEITINEHTILGISEKACYDTAFTNGNNMQFWVTFDDEQSLTAAYKVLGERGEVHYPLSSCEWCGLAADITDKYGVRWLLNML